MSSRKKLRKMFRQWRKRNKSRLRQKEPKTTTTGLGYVSAGLLLWLESSEAVEVVKEAGG